MRCKIDLKHELRICQHNRVSRTVSFELRVTFQIIFYFPNTRLNIKVRSTISQNHETESRYYNTVSLRAAQSWWTSYFLSSYHFSLSGVI